MNHLSRLLQAAEDYMILPSGFRSIDRPTALIAVELTSRTEDLATWFKPLVEMSQGLKKLELAMRDLGRALEDGSRASSSAGLQQKLDALEALHGQLMSHLEACLDPTNGCRQRDVTELMQKSASALKAAIIPLHFLDFCFSTSLRGGQQKLLDLLRSRSSTQDCLDLNDWLESQSSLDLSGSSLKDITILAGLSNLHDLDLSHNLLTDAATLTTLQGLRYLNLSDNKVETLDLSQSPDLYSLHAIDTSLTSLVLPTEVAELNLVGSPISKDSSFDHDFAAIPKVRRLPKDICNDYLDFLVGEERITTAQLRQGRDSSRFPLFDSLYHIREWQSCDEHYAEVFQAWR